MKKIQKLALSFMMGGLALCFASCGSDDDTTFDLPNVGQATTTINSSDLAMQKTTKAYVENVVYPTYQALAKNSRELYTACTTLYKAAEAGTMTQSQIDAACEAFKNARREWERSEAFLYGSASDNNIDPHIDSWPLDQCQPHCRLQERYSREVRFRQERAVPVCIGLPWYGVRPLP